MTNARQLGGVDGPLGSPLHVRVLLDGRLRVYKVAAGLRVADAAAQIYPEHPEISAGRGAGRDHCSLCQSPNDQLTLVRVFPKNR
jgi:hypothetical protein